MKIAVIGAGSISFGIGLIKDIALSEKLNSQNLEVSLMDISDKNLKDVYKFSKKIFEKTNRNVTLNYTMDLDTSVDQADYVVVAIEVDRYKHWQEDFHIPKLYGSTQAYGENGGPGGMFHALRNFQPILDIARAMEKLCPNALLINYTNPEAKLIEMLNRLSTIKCVGLCHGLPMGLHQIAEICEIKQDDIAYVGGGLNHFGWFLELKNKNTNEDLYPLLRKKESEIDPLYSFEHFALSREMFKLYGLYPYPGNNHIGEYVRYGKEFYAAHVAQFYHDRVLNTQGRFIYAADGDSLTPKRQFIEYNDYYNIDHIHCSGELAVPIMEAITFDIETPLFAVNMANNGVFSGIDNDMVIESQAIANKDGITFIHKNLELPTAIKAMTSIQGSIHKLLIEAFNEGSKDKLLQAILLDPQCPEYSQAIKMIDEMCEIQKELLPQLNWLRTRNEKNNN